MPIKCQSLTISESNLKKVESENNSQLKEIYYDKTSYCGINEVKRKTGKSQKETVKFSHQQDTYTKHKPVKKNFKRERIYVYYPDQQWQADLAFSIYEKITVINIF